MKKQIVYMVLLFSMSLFAQAPQSFNYQSVIKDSGGNILSNQNVGVQFIIHQTAATGSAVYTETWNVSTNAYGVLNTRIGQGTTTDDFSIINWGAGPYFLEVLVDTSGGTNYVSIGTSQLMSTPYALHAEYATNDAVNDADADATNELQSLSTTSNGINRTLSITDSNDTTISIADNDNDATNEIQDLTKSFNGTNRTLNITGGTGTTFSIADNDNDSSNEIQNLSSITGGTNRSIVITGGGNATVINVADNDNQAVNEIQNLNLNLNNQSLNLTKVSGSVSLANIGVKGATAFSGTGYTINANTAVPWLEVPTENFITVQGTSDYLVFVSFRCKIQGGSGDDFLNFRIRGISISCTDAISNETGVIETLKEHRGEYGLVSFKRVLNLTGNCPYNLRLQVFTDDTDDTIHFDNIVVTAIKIN